MKRAVFVVFVLAFLGPAGTWANGPESLLPSVDPDGPFRLLSAYDETTTSTCVGDPRTPLCAVETSIACHLRDDPELCRIAYDEPPAPPIPFRTKRKSRIVEGYRVVGVRHYRAGDIPDWEPSYWLPAVGDVAINLETTNCTYGKCGEFIDKKNYLARPTPTGWKVERIHRRWQFTWLPPPRLRPGSITRHRGCRSRRSRRECGF